jgi:hypothetical protein
LGRPRAIEHLREALDLSHDIDDPWMQVTALKALARAEPESRTDHLERAKLIAMACGFRPELAEIERLRAEAPSEFDTRRGQPEGAAAEKVLAGAGRSPTSGNPAAPGRATKKKRGRH